MNEESVLPLELQEMKCFVLHQAAVQQPDHGDLPSLQPPLPPVAPAASSWRAGQVLHCFKETFDYQTPPPTTKPPPSRDQSASCSPLRSQHTSWPPVPSLMGGAGEREETPQRQAQTPSLS